MDWMFTDRGARSVRGQRGTVRRLHHNVMGDVADVWMDTIQADGSRWRTVRVTEIRALSLIEAIGELE